MIPPIMRKLLLITYGALVIVVLMELRALNKYRMFESLDRKTVQPLPTGALPFETYRGYKMRLQIQENLQYGAHLKQLHEDSFNTREGYHESFLDSLPIVRETDNITDFALPECKNMKYKKSGMKVSVIMNFHNELLSLLLRSIYSVLISIPPENFQEMIIIDDASNLTKHYDLTFLGDLLKQLTVPVHLHRFEKNVGLIYSRRFGCMHATGDAVLVLDSHVEVKPGFLEPLLDIVESNYKSIPAPVFDFWDTFKNSFWSYDGSTLEFDHYITWIFDYVPKTTHPYHTPAILGGAFLATTRFLKELDYFGGGMEGWGSENIEVSLKSWYCGGEVFYVPCSRVLHYSANRRPIAHGDRSKPTNLNLNTGIIAKAFFPDDEYWDVNKLFSFDKDVAQRMEYVERTREVLKQNNCNRDFKWLRRNVMPKMESYDADTVIAVGLSNSEGTKCLSRKSVDDVLKPVLESCAVLAGRPIRDSARFTIWGDLRLFDRRCLDWGAKEGLAYYRCHQMKGNQESIYDPKQQVIKDASGYQCMVAETSTGYFVSKPCKDLDKLGPDYTLIPLKIDKIYNETALHILQPR